MANFPNFYVTLISPFGSFARIFSGSVLPPTMPNLFIRTIPSNVLVSQMTPFFPPDQIFSDDVYDRGKIS